MKTKQELWLEIAPKFTHLQNYCQIEVRGLDDESSYYHPKFILDDNTYITSQGDNTNRYIYAFRFYYKKEDEFIGVDFDECLLDNVVLGWSINQEAVMVAFDTLNKLKQHVNTLNGYITEQVTNMLIGNSINEITDRFISELKTTKALVNHIQKTK